MQYQITSDNIELSPSMETLAKEKFERVERRIEEIIPEDARFARVVMNTAPEGMFTVKANLVIDGKEYFSDETDYTLEGALVKTVEEILVMMEKEKTQQKRQMDKQDIGEMLQDQLSDVE